MKRVVEIERKSAFNKGVKKLQKDHRIKTLDKLEKIIEELVEYKISNQYANHTLKGKLKGESELHIEDDVQLTYHYENDKLVLVLVDLGNHDLQSNSRHQTQIKKQLNNSLEEDGGRYPKIDLSHIHSSELKKLVKGNFKGTKEQRDDFNFAITIDNKATVIKETDKAILVQLFYDRWNSDRTAKIKKTIFSWLPKNLFLRPSKNKDDKSIKETIKSDCRANLRGLRESSESSNEYFTKEEIKTLPNELAKYFQEQSIPKYYDISVEDMGDKKYLLRGNIDYGEVNHDHRYFDNKVKEFFNEKGIQVDVYEPENLKGTIDEDGIYSSAHIIQKQGNMVYKPQDNELDNFIDNNERE